MIRLGLVIDEETVWPHRGQGDGCGDFDPEDVLSYLCDAWPYLMLSQIWPIQFDAEEEPRSLTGLLRAAEERWDQFGKDDQDQADREQFLLDEFLYHHDLSQMKHGAGLPPCYVLKQQLNLRVEVEQEVFGKILFSNFSQQLIDLGDFAINLLRDRIAHEDRSAVQLKARWDAREEIDPVLAAALISGIAPVEIGSYETLKHTLIKATSSRTVTEIANDNSNPILAAARCSGALGPAGMVAVLDKIQAFAPGDSTSLAKHRRELKRQLRDVSGPTEQGIRAATVGRCWLKIGESDPVDPEALSSLLGIHVEYANIADERLDGIACADARHGPAILLNRYTRRQGGRMEDLDRSLRFTWVHEIGHLLLDDEEWPALVDAVLQRVPRAVETRANAFAAHLLLPTATAYRRWEDAGMPLSAVDLEEMLNSLCGTYGLSRVAVARQVSRGAPVERRRQLEDALRAYART